MARGIPIVPPPGLVARRVVVDGEELVVFSYPIGDEEKFTPAPDRLTKAETAVLRLLLAGRSNAEIAHARHVTVSTVAKQVEKLFRRFDVHSRAELAAHPGLERYR